MKTIAAFLVAMLSVSAWADPGDPLPGLSASEVAAFEAGKAEFASGTQTASGDYRNHWKCGYCHRQPQVVGGYVPLYNRQTLTGFKPVLDCDYNEAIGAADFNCFRKMFGEDAASDPMEDTVPGNPPEGGILWQRHVAGVPGQIVPEVLPAEHPLKVAVKLEHANVLSLRDGPDVLGLGLIEQISTQQIEDACATSGGEVRYDESVPPRPVRFGTQGQMGATLTQANEEAHRAQIGLYDAGDVDRHTKLIDFMKYLAPYERRVNPQTDPDLAEGRDLFIAAGCDSCHTLEPYAVDGGNQIMIGSDLCFHDLGPINDDGVQAQSLRSGAAAIDVTSSMWLTPPLWRHPAPEFMHDGSAATLKQSLWRHGGEAKDEANTALSEWDAVEIRNVEHWILNGFFDAGAYSAP